MTACTPTRRAGEARVTDRPALDAVLLDAGGTLVRLDFEWMSAMLAGHGVSIGPEAIRRAEVAGRRAYDASRGTPVASGVAAPPLGTAGDTDAYFRGMLVAAGIPAALVPLALERFRARHAEVGLWVHPMEGARAALDGLAALGLALAVVSNSDGRAERHLVDCGVREGLEFVLDSHHAGIEKPDPEIFHAGVRRLGTRPERVLFVGDIRCVDEAGARAAGTQFVLIDPYGDYAAPGTPAIAAIAGLPEWTASHFEVPGRRAASPPSR